MVQPIVTVEEMRAIDAAAPVGTSVLVDRAGRALAQGAVDLLGGTYGRRVVIYAGGGTNGDDGRAAAHHLEARGVRCEVVGPADSPRHLDRSDLVIDACFGTGLSRPFRPPPTAGRPVLAADIPSGLDPMTGEVQGDAIAATATVTFGALTPGLLLGAGPDLVGRLTVASLGLDTSRATAYRVEESDLESWPRRPRRAHKWSSAVWLIGGGPGTSGALRLASMAAARAGAGHVLVSSPGNAAVGHVESVFVELPPTGWAAAGPVDRVAAIIVGPGLVPTDQGARELRSVIDNGRPLVIDAGGLDLASLVADHLRARTTPAVLTPHEGEFSRLFGGPPGADRLAATRSAAAELGSVVVLKGAPTVVASPAGECLVVTAGDQRLATAGTGDVLAGIIGAGLAQGLEPLMAAGLGAELHARWAPSDHDRPWAMVASDLLGPA